MKTILETQTSNQKSLNTKKYLAVGLAAALGLSVYIFINLTGSTSGAAIDANDIYIGTVKQGNLIKDIRAPGNLVANQRQWLSAHINARVVKRVLEPGAQVTKDSIIIELESPSLVQNYKQAKIALKVARAQLDALKQQQQTVMHELEATVSLLAIEKEQAIADMEAKKILRVATIIPQYQFNESVLRTEQLSRQLEIESFKFKRLPALQVSLLKVEQAKVEQQQLATELLANQVELLNVRAGISGILQSLSVEQGQQVARGTELARVASQDNLKAELRVQESQVKDILIGQKVIIDTRRSKIAGTIARIDPAVVNGTVTVDVSLSGKLPLEARPDLRVEGVVEIERLENVLMIDKPANWQNHSSATNGSAQSASAYLYKLSGDSLATKTPVTFGLNSVSSVQIVSGLEVSERVILSDLSKLAQHQQLQILN